MAEELQLALLGNLEIRLDGVPVTGFISSKVQALLCYLAATGRPCLRPTLAGLLWGEMPEASARNNLSKALTNLRQLVGHYLNIDRQAVAFNQDSTYWLDVELFEAFVGGAAAETDIDSLQRAVELYRGDFLEGFYVHQAPAFEEWVLAQRARLRELALQALHTLAVHHTCRGEVGRAASIDYTTRLLALEPWREEAHRQLMLLLVLSGQRSAALVQYQTCCQVLAEELDVEPAEETVLLYEQIRTGKLEVPIPIRQIEIAPRPPSFLEEGARERLGRSVFVARERELECLDVFLETALAGQGQVVFVTGEAGSGKTALIQEFTRRAQERHADLIVASGNCNAHTGVGDPYLPFREVLGLLTGDVESRWAAGVIDKEHAHRLWNALPSVVQALVDRGPDLINSFVPGRALVARATAAAPQGADWLERLKDVTNGERLGPGQMEQRHFFVQYTTVLHVLAAQRPVLIVLDDLQWVDAASINLLFHLGRNLAGSRILLMGAYRPDEVALGRPAQSLGIAERHPLEKVLTEFKGIFGDIWIDLDETMRVAGREFVDALLDMEPNQLGAGFRQAFYGHTGGHPLFAVELLRDAQERGALVRDDDGQWIEGRTLDWSVLPARVEGVIEERIGRLEEDLRETLTVASVEGKDFTAQVVARVREVDQRGLVRQLSRELDKKHHLVSERGSRQAGRQHLYRYRFRHSLFQQYLYNELGEIERKLMHWEVGAALEALYEGEIEEIVPQLARHFSEAGEAEKAVHYLLLAGDRARGLYAHREAIDHYQRALALLREQRDYERAARTLMKLGLTYHNAFSFRQARQAYEEGFLLWERVGRMQPAVPPLPASQAFRVDWFEGVMTLDPTMAADDSSTDVIRRLFSGLVKRGPEMEILPDLARTWEILDGGRTYVFRLRDDVRWSDGAPVTARDCEYAWKRALTPAIGSPVASVLYDVKGARAFHQGQLTDPNQVGVRARDQVTLVVELEGPTGYFLQLLGHSVTHPLPRHVIEAHGESWTEVGNIVTNGPFRLEAWQQGECMVLRRNLAYYGSFRGNLQRLELCLITDPETRLQRYEAGDLDVLLLWSLLPAEIDRARQRHAGEYISGPFLQTLFVVFDVSRPPFNDPRVRRALILAIDKETLADVVMQGTEVPATGGFVPPGMPGHSPEIGLPYDPDQARELLDEAGYPKGGGLSFPVVGLLAPHGAEFISEYLQVQWWENLQVKIAWEILESFTFLDKLDQAPPHLFLLGWAADYPDPDNFLRVSRRVGRWSGWQNETYDTLVSRARHLLDQEGRMKLYRQADRILIEEAAIMPLTYGRLHMLVKPWVRKFPVSPISHCIFEDVIIEPH